MNIFKKTFTSIILCLLSIYSFAQNSLPATAQNSTDIMESNGKIYVVVAVVVVIIVGLFIYLFGLDKKIARLEKEEQKP